MRLFPVLFLLLLGCSSSTEPEPRRVLGTVVGYNEDDPAIELDVEGTSVTVTVFTYGNGCFSPARTEVHRDGFDATITPYDYDPGCPQRDLRTIRHSATLDFDGPGTARIVIRGLDRSAVSAEDPKPDTVLIERLVVIE